MGRYRRKRRSATAGGSCLSSRDPHGTLLRLPLNRRLIALLGLALVGLAMASTASATAPGKNGRIAFRRYFDAQQTFDVVFTMAADGSQERQTTRPPQGTVDDQPSWSSDGSLITFTRCPSNGGLCHVWTVRPDGSEIQPAGTVCPTVARGNLP